MKLQDVRVRIAPSPTGEPHVGTAWVALMNLAFARHNNGKFVLRIEDTDRERSHRQWEEEILTGLRWLGLTWDEGPDVGGPFGPYRQSERRELYAEAAQNLIASGHAYRCFCSKERLDELRNRQKQSSGRLGYDRFCRQLDEATIEANLRQGLAFTIRMKMPTEGHTRFVDALRGEVTFDNVEIDDQILLKSDGFPTYHLANVVDDHHMLISHVIRAEEWISSTPKHVVLYQMFGWSPPVWVHLPLLRNQDKSKISKRKNPVSILDYQSRGFLPEAVVNYLSTLGFTMPDGREIFDFQEFAAAFELDRIILGGPIFDLDKMSWFNGKYFREQLSEAELNQLIIKQVLDPEYIAKIVPLLKERIDRGEDFIPMAEYFFSGSVQLNVQDLVSKKYTMQALAKALEAYAERIDKQINFGAVEIEAMSRNFTEEIGWRAGDFFMPLRIAVTGRKASPPLFETMSVLGRARIRRRLAEAVQKTKLAAKNAPAAN